MFQFYPAWKHPKTGGNKDVKIIMLRKLRLKQKNSFLITKNVFGET